MLKRPPEEISVLDVFEALQGRLTILDCIDTPNVCERSSECIVRPIWLEMQEAQRSVLRQKTVKDLMGQSGETCEIGMDINL